MTLTDLIFRKNGENPGICITEGEKEYSYAEMFRGIASVQAFLEKNANAGDRVGILCENGFEFISSYLACYSSGVVAVPINTTTYSSELGYITNDCQIQAILSSARFFSSLDFPRKFIIPEILQTRAGGYKISAVKDDSLALLMYTSGSTGRPNAVKITHRNLLANTLSIGRYLQMDGTDRMMVVLPFYYCYGASLMHTTLVSGGMLVINNRFMFPQKVVDEIAERGCTIFAGVPSTYKILMAGTRLAESGAPSLRYALQAGGHLPPSDLFRLQKMLPGTKVIVMYGQTEATARLSYLPHEFFDSKMGSIGKGIPGTELQVVDEHGAQVKPGEVGEIRARGDNVSPGYWNRPEETKKTFRGGWLYTGDMGTVDEDGFVYVVGRSKDFVKAGGNRFSAMEVEDLISSLEGVDNVAAIGVPDDILGECVHAFVVSKADVKEGDIISLCRRKLPSYKVPQKVTFLKELPLNAFGKVQKFRLMSGWKADRRLKASGDAFRESSAFGLERGDYGK
jgi:long-chain acyl-CoA synthetase